MNPRAHRKVFHLSCLRKLLKLNANVITANMVNAGSFLFLSLALFASMTFHLSFTWDGPIKSRHQQCIEDNFIGACDFIYPNGSTEYSCINLRCALKAGDNEDGTPIYTQHSGKQPVNGTYCGDCSFCRNLKCEKHAPSKLPEYYKDNKMRVEGCN